MTQKTAQEIEALKTNWLADPNWDIEKTEGFEEHREELIAFRAEIEARWRQKEIERVERRRHVVRETTGIDDPLLAESLSTFAEIENELQRLDSLLSDGGSSTDNCQFAVACEQVRATLLLAAQIKRVGDLLEEKIEEDASSSALEFMTKLYSRK